MYAGTLIKRLVNEKYDGHGNIREHILKMSNLAARLKAMEIKISDGFLVHFIINSLPKDYDTFAVNYNSMNEKWDIEKLIAMCAQEEERLRTQRIDYINQVRRSPPPQKDQDKRNQQPVDKDTCYRCKKKGHHMKDCPVFLKWLNKKGIPY